MMRSSPPRSTTGARPPLDSGEPPALPLAGRGGRAAPGGGCGRRQAVPVAVPQVPPAGSLGGARSGPRDPRALGRRPRGPPGTCVPAVRPAGDREDLDGADPGQDGELRVRPHPRTLRLVRSVRGRSRRAAPGRGRDRRGLPRRGRRRARPPREGAHGAGPGPREGLHHRRGAAAVARGVRRAAEGVRGAAGGRPVRARDHRAAQDAGHDRRALPAVRLPPRPGRGGRRAPRTHREGRGHVPHLGGRARDRAADRGFGPRRALAARPGLGARRGRDRRGHRPVADRQRPFGRAVRARRRGGGRGREGRVRARQPARAGGAGPAARHQRGARALPQPPARQDRAGPARPARRHRRGGRAPDRAGREVLGGRARPRDRAPDRGADRHALDHLPAPLPRARADPSHDPRDRRSPRGPRVAARTVGAGGGHHSLVVAAPGTRSRARTRRRGRRPRPLRPRLAAAPSRPLPRPLRRRHLRPQPRPTRPPRQGGRPRPEPGKRPTRRHRRSKRRASGPRRAPQRAAPKRPRPVRPRPVRRPRSRRGRCWGPGRRRWT